MPKIILIFALGCLLSCSEKGKLADQMTEIPGSKWNYNQIPDYPFTINNTGIYYDFYLKLRIQKSYPYENLYLLAHIRNPAGKISTQRINFNLTDETGKPHGKSSGNIISYEMPMFPSKRMAQAGQYSIAIEQNMRDSVVVGIESIGVKIKEGIPVF